MINLKLEISQCDTDAPARGQTHPQAGILHLVTFCYVFLMTCYIFLPLAPPRGMTLGQRYHILKGLDVGKCHIKFQLSSPKGIKVISCKRNADVNLHLNLQVNLNPVTNVTYAHMHVSTYACTDVISWRNAICPTPAKGRRGHKKTCC